MESPSTYFSGFNINDLLYLGEAALRTLWISFWAISIGSFIGIFLGLALSVSRVIAYTLGAVWIERHFTKDRTWKGTDHAASLEPQGLQKLVRDLTNTYEALSFKNSEILEIEKEQRVKLKFNG